jgi:hypothetical protein
MTRSRNRRDSRPTARDSSGVRSLVPWLLGAAGLLVLLVGLALALRSPGQSSTSAPLVSGQPKLVVDQERVDFGEVPINKKVKATFKLTNVGDQPLRITGQPQVRVVEGC